MARHFYMGLTFREQRRAMRRGRVRESGWIFGRAIVVAILVVTAACWAGLTPAAADEKKSVAEKLLDVLKANKQITEQQYKELLKEAKEEKDAAKADLEAAKEEREAARADREAARAEIEAVKATKTAKAEKEIRPEDFRAFWKNGLNFETGDKDFKMHIGGRVQVDAAEMDANNAMRRGFASSLQPATPTASTNSLDAHGAEFRRARLQIDGTIFKDIEFMTELDFAQNVVTFQDVYMGLKNIPYIGRIRVGRFKEPLSLEDLVSDNWTTFMERSLADCFAPSRNIGAAVSNSEFDGRMTWALGVFEQTVSSGVGSGFAISHYPDMNMTARITGLPWYEEEGRRLLHLGFGYSHKFRDPTDSSSATSVRFNSRPEAHLYPVSTVDTKPITNVEGVNIVNPELAFVYGPFSIQGEWFGAYVDRTVHDASFNGWYIFASYFLTGESRPYNKSIGNFDRPIPKHNFSLGKGGWGAWEAAFRASQVDLNDRTANILGGKETDYTVGINWYLNPCIKVMFNYVHADLENRDNVTPKINDGAADIFESRFQVAF
jgi:phosphate-selective porin OprO/OprP